MLPSFLFIKWRKEKERGQDENDRQVLVLWESCLCITLIVVKDLLWSINFCDKVLPSRVTGRIFASTRSGDLVSNSLNLEWGSFDLEDWSLFVYGMHEEEEGGAHRLDAMMNHSSS